MRKRGEKPRRLRAHSSPAIHMLGEFGTAFPVFGPPLDDQVLK